MGLDKLRASEPESHVSGASESCKSCEWSHARQMLVPSPFSFLRLLAIWHEFSHPRSPFNTVLLSAFIFFIFF